MALTLEEASKLSSDLLLRGVVETIVKDSPILERLPFIQIVGNSLKYNREKTLPAVSWYAPVTGTWTQSEPEWEQCTASLCLLGGDADVDNYLKATRSNIQDLEAAVIEAKAKALRHEFENAFINGDSSQNANQPDGLYKILKGINWQAQHSYSRGEVVVPTSGSENGFRYECTTAGTSGSSQPAWTTIEGETVNDGTVVWTCRLGNHLASGVNGATLTLDRLDRLIDLIRGSKPDMLLMSRRSRRKLMSLIRATGAVLETRPGRFGEMIQYYNGIPVFVSDWIRDNYAQGASSDCSVIFALCLGEGAVCGLSSPEMVQVERLGSLETKDATRTRIKWYVSWALFSTIRAAMLSGVRD